MASDNATALLMKITLLYRVQWVYARERKRSMQHLPR
jgi:hypothetical protein